jgi:RNA polymerase sigma-70 factor (ECF subfamily)
MVSRELVERCRRGERGAFDELVERTHRQVYTQAYRLVGDRHEAEDVSQEAYLRVFRSVGGFREDARFETWLYRIVANVAFTHLKRKGRFGRVLADGPAEGHDAEPAGMQEARPVDAIVDREEVKRVLRELPEGLRVVLVLRDVYGLTMKEIGEEMGLSEGAVKVRLHRARKRLRESVGSER